MRHLSPLLLCLCLTVSARAATINAASTSQAHVQAAIDSATAGDTVVIPAGSVTWSGVVSLNKAITLQGSGTWGTIISLDAAGPSWGSGVISVSGGNGCVLQNLSFIDPTTSSVTAIATSGNSWRITNVKYRKTGDGGNPAYFIAPTGYGLIDHCDMASVMGQSEMIFIAGPSDSWTTADGIGTVNNVFIEDCVTDDAGYLCDAHNNSRAVIRFNTMNGSNKIDAHGLQSASPRGARHTEVYNNTFTYSGYVMFIELRSGTGRCFNNTATYDTNWLGLVEYYVTVGGQTSAGYPFNDQIGIGQDPKSAASAPYYVWGNRHGASLKWLVDRAPGGASMDGTIDLNRDYFEEPSGTFNGTAGVGIGTAAQMNAITPTTTGVGYWVTDEGEWNSTNGATADGRLYRWSGSAWVLNYTPYTYPHPLQSGGGGGSSPTMTTTALTVGTLNFP